MDLAIPGLVTPHSTSEFEAMVEACRKHHYDAKDQYEVVAAELGRNLRRVKGAKLLSLDTKMAARRVRKQLAKSSRYEEYAARSTIRALSLYRELFLGIRPASHDHGFDINR